MSEYAQVPANKPANTAIYQLPPVNVGGSKFYGYKMIYFKSVDTGKKDKNGREIIKSVPDKAKPVIYDAKTQQIKSNQQNQLALSQVLLQIAKQKHINAQLLLSIAKLTKGAK